MAPTEHAHAQCTVPLPVQLARLTSLHPSCWSAAPAACKPTAPWQVGRGGHTAHRFCATFLYNPVIPRPALRSMLCWLPHSTPMHVSFTPADLWSLGVMLYEALAGRTPFGGGPNLAAILRAALKNEYPPLPACVSTDCRDLVAALLQPNPQRRITLEAVLQHPWLRQGLQHVRELSPLPAEEAEVEADATVDREGRAGGSEGPPPGTSAEQAAVGRSRRSSRADGGSEGGSGSLLSRPPSEHSSLALQLPGGQAAAAGPLAAVPEEASQRCLSRFPSRVASKLGYTAGDRSSQPGSPAGSGSPSRLVRGRSLEAAQRRTDASPKAGDGSRGLAKAASSKTFSISARAE